MLTCYLHPCRLQNFFRSYPKLAGMTGTAETESQEFQSIYRLPVTVVPPNRTVARTDQPDVVFRNEAGEPEAQRHELLTLWLRSGQYMSGCLDDQGWKPWSPALPMHAHCVNVGLKSSSHRLGVKLLATQCCGGALLARQLPGYSTMFCR